MGMNLGFGRDPGGGINGGGPVAGVVFPINHEDDGIFRGETEVLGDTFGGGGDDGEGAGEALEGPAMEIDMVGVEVVGNILASADNKDMGDTHEGLFHDLELGFFGDDDGESLSPGFDFELTLHPKNLSDEGFEVFFVEGFFGL